MEDVDARDLNSDYDDELLLKVSDRLYLTISCVFVVESFLM